MEEFADAPFMIVGVNSDKSMEKIREIVVEKELTWPSFFDGGGTSGPIATQWGVRGWPTVYVLDHEGVIRSTRGRGPALDAILADLIPKAIEAQKTANSGN